MKRNIKDDKSYFLTMTAIQWIDFFTRPNLKNVIVDSLNYAVENKGLNIFAWVLMSNHLHLLANTHDNVKLSDVVRDFKKFTCKKIVDEILNQKESRRNWLMDKVEYNGRIAVKNEMYKVWQDGNHAVEIYSEDFTWQKLNYIHQNPVRAQIVELEEHYLHSSARDYHGMPGLVKVECLTPPVMHLGKPGFFRV